MADISRRRLLGLGAGAMSALMLGACGGKGDSGSDSNGFTVGEWGGVWDKALTDLNPDLQKGTGLTITNAVYGSGAAQTIVERNPGKYDVAWMIPSVAADAMKKGIVQGIDTSKVEAWGDIYPALKESLSVDGAVYGVPISWGVSGILYRKDIIGFDLTSWKDLWRPELKGQITIQNAPSSGGLIVMLAASKVFGSGLKDVETGWAKMKELKPNIKFLYDKSSDPINKLVDGSVAVAVTFADFGIGLQDKGVKTAVPVEGSDSGPQLITIPAKAKPAHMDQIYRYINYMLRPEAQIAWSRATQVYSANSKVVLPADVQSTLVETPDTAKTLWDLDYLWFGENQTAWTEQWQRIFAG